MHLKHKIGKGSLYLTKYWFGRSEICCAEDNYNNMSNMCEKELSDWNFNLALIAKILMSKEIA